MRRMKHFMNERSAVVTEAIDATVALSGGKLARLDGFPAIKVVVRTDADPNHVAVISGGGSGHEPAHVGFVGDGLLTAAVCGEIFASPSVDAVLAAIVAVTGKAGCLLIVKSYTGDRLNFGLAAERARARGLAVEMVVVGDDIAIDNALRPRGIAGTLFVHKVAGHYARAGKSLTDVRDLAARAAARVASIGLSLTSCSIPGQPFEERIGPGDVELGLGIHGEPGASLVPIAPIRELAEVMTKRAEEALGSPAPGRGPVALLVNDLGGVPPIEMAVATGAVLEAMKREVALVIGPNRMMTSLDMKGFSISLLALDDELETALTSEVGPRAWPKAQKPIRIAPRVTSIQVADVAPSSDPVRRRVVETLCATFIAKEAELNALDAKVGDGDTGSTFATAARSIRADLDRLPFADRDALCAALSDRLAKVMGGSSGILLAIFTAAAARGLRAGLDAVQHYGGAAQGDRTMLDAFIPALEAMEAGKPMKDVAAAARAGAEATKDMTAARAGRSSYVRSDALRGVPDPGAMAVAYAFEALA
jgi:dihydroxyacetone kinase